MCHPFFRKAVKIAEGATTGNSTQVNYANKCICMGRGEGDIPQGPKENTNGVGEVRAQACCTNDKTKDTEPNRKGTRPREIGTISSSQNQNKLLASGPFLCKPKARCAQLVFPSSSLIRYTKNKGRPLGRNHKNVC